MKVFIDSSSFAKRYIQESGSEKLASVLQTANDLAFSVILLLEIISSLNRLVREQLITSTEYQKLKQDLLADIANVTIIQLTPEVIASSLKLLETNSLRAMDALHIASALEWKADLFLSSDKRQLKAAKTTALKTIYIN